MEQNNQDSLQDFFITANLNKNSFSLLVELNPGLVYPVVLDRKRQYFPLIILGTVINVNVKMQKT